MKNKIRQINEDEGKRNPAYKKILIVMSVIFSLYSLTLIFPFLWLVLNSLKTKQEFFSGNPFSMPSGEAGLKNYAEMFSVFPIGEMFFNSVTLSLICPTVSVFVTACAAYIVGKFRFFGRNVVYFLGLLVMFFSVSGTLAATFKLLNALELMDTLIAMVLLTSSAFGFNFLLLTGAFKGVSNAYREAAMLDGASEWKIYFFIYLPQVFPTITAIWILNFIGQWNDYTGAYLFYNSHQTLSTGIKYISDNIKTGEYQLDYPKLFACMILSVVPIIVLFACFQKQIMRLNMGGGIKG